VQLDSVSGAGAGELAAELRLTRAELASFLSVSRSAMEALSTHGRSGTGGRVADEHAFYHGKEPGLPSSTDASARLADASREAAEARGAMERLREEAARRDAERASLRQRL